MDVKDRQKKIAVIEDMCGYGRCSLSAALPIISAFGIQACPIPTAIFSNHTAFPAFYRTDYTDSMADYVKPWNTMKIKFDGILSGYLANTGQVRHVIDIIDKFADRECMVVVDPVMGDDGILYKCVDGKMKTMLRELAGRAQIITPNLTEACALAGVDYDKNMTSGQLFGLGESLKKLGPDNIVITGICMGDDIGNLCISGDKMSMIKIHRTGDNRCGTGDVFAAVITALLVSGMQLEMAVEDAAGFIAKAIERSDELGIDKRNGLAFETFMSIDI